MRSLIISLLISSAVFLFVGFFLRCFPLGCIWLDWKELLKVFLYVFIPVFGLSLLGLKLRERRLR
ncbi:MAG: hypothetical protein HXS54_10045 [Theionarchaea archaeon]|nr:hypothetical protein [Theionarchaea archaeon]